MRYSHIRESILHFVQESKIHPTTNMVHKQILKHIPNVSHVTIYRNLEKLVKMNKISIVNRKSPGRYCGNTNSHGHFYCNKCYCPQFRKISYLHKTNIWTWFMNLGLGMLPGPWLPWQCSSCCFWENSLECPQTYGRCVP